MTQDLRNALMVACAFAGEFQKSADAELRGASDTYRKEAVDQLAASLKRIQELTP